MSKDLFHLFHFFMKTTKEIGSTACSEQVHLFEIFVFEISSDEKEQRNTYRYFCFAKVSSEPVFHYKYINRNISKLAKYFPKPLERTFF